MPAKDLYERLCNYFGLQMGEVPDRENLLTAFKYTLSEDDLSFYFLLPMFGEISQKKLIRKASQNGFSDSQIEMHIDKLIKESFIERHYGESTVHFARVMGAFVAENQVRKKKGTALGKRYAKYWMDLAEVSTYHLPTKTPYARVLPVEETISESSQSERIQINEPIEDTSQAVPYDFVTEMIRNTHRIALAECYCRLSMEMAGKPCSHEKETCFLFNEAARSLIETGVAREVTVEEALEIVHRCEQAGLVHNVNNCEDEITFLCNCCPCCCPILGALNKGLTNVGQPSRFIPQFDQTNCQACGNCVEICHVNALEMSDPGIVFDQERCIGCGLCASHCPQEAINMVLRENPQPIYDTSTKLDSKIQREAIFGKLKSWIFGG